MRVLPATNRFAARSGTWLKEAERCDVVFVPSEITFQRYETPIVLAVRNASLALSLVRESPLRLKARFVAQREFARRSAKWSAAHIAVSRHAAHLATTNLRIPPERVHVVYHGGPAQVRPVVSTPAHRFLFVSNLYRYKNVKRAIIALAAIGGEWTLDLVGGEVEPAFSQELRQLTEKLGLEERIRFRGHLSGDSLQAAYLEADCFLWPPYAETFGHPLLEAHAFGLPIIAAEAASNREIAGDAAVYFEPFDVEDLQGKLIMAMTTGLQTGPLPRSYSWEDCAAGTVKVLQGAVGRY